MTDPVVQTDAAPVAAAPVAASAAIDTAKADIEAAAKRRPWVVVACALAVGVVGALIIYAVF